MDSDNGTTSDRMLYGGIVDFIETLRALEDFVCATISQCQAELARDKALRASKRRTIREMRVHHEELEVLDSKIAHALERHITTLKSR